MQAIENLVFEQDEEEKAMSTTERRKLIAFLEKQGWTVEQILALFKYISE